MNVDLQNLISLQKIDSVLDDFKRKDDQLRVLLEKEQAVVGEYERKLEEAKARQEEATKLVRELEREVTDLDGKMAKYRAQLLEVKTNREYTSIQIEISSLQDKKDRLEEQIIRELEKGELMKRGVEAAAAELEQARQVLKAKQAEHDGVSRELRGHIQREEAMRQEAADKLSKILTERYRKIRNARGGVAIARVDGGNCLGCHINLPPQLIIEVRKGKEILDCCSCGRILYMGDDE